MGRKPPSIVQPNMARGVMKFCAFILLLALPVSAADWQEYKNVKLDESGGKLDGDSIPVLTDDESFILNLYFIDAPETSARYPDKPKEQAEYFGLSLEESLSLGKTATEFVRAKLEGGFTVHSKRAQITTNDDKVRYYGMIEIGNKFLSELLVEAGLVRIKGRTTSTPDEKPSSVFLAKLEKLEKKAKLKKVGGWGDQNDPVKEPKPEEPAPEKVAEASPVESKIITLQKSLPVFVANPEFRSAGKLKAGRRIKIVDADPLIRILIARPGKNPVEAFVRQSDL